MKLVKKSDEETLEETKDLLKRFQKNLRTMRKQGEWMRPEYEGVRPVVIQNMLKDIAELKEQHKELLKKIKNKSKV